MSSDPRATTKTAAGADTKTQTMQPKGRMVTVTFGDETVATQYPDRSKLTVNNKDHVCHDGVWVQTMTPRPPG